MRPIGVKPAAGRPKPLRSQPPLGCLLLDTSRSPTCYVFCAKWRRSMSDVLPAILHLRCSGWSLQFSAASCWFALLAGYLAWAPAEMDYWLGRGPPPLPPVPHFLPGDDPRRPHLQHHPLSSANSQHCHGRPSANKTRRLYASGCPLYAALVPFSWQSWSSPEHSTIERQLPKWPSQASNRKGEPSWL